MPASCQPCARCSYGVADASHENTGTSPRERRRKGRSKQGERQARGSQSGQRQRQGRWGVGAGVDDVVVVGVAVCLRGHRRGCSRSCCRSHRRSCIRGHRRGSSPSPLDRYMPYIFIARLVQHSLRSSTFIEVCLHSHCDFNEEGMGRLCRWKKSH